MEEQDSEKDWIEKLETVGKQSSDNEEHDDTEVETESNSPEISSSDGMGCLLVIVGVVVFAFSARWIPEEKIVYCVIALVLKIFFELSKKGG